MGEATIPVDLFNPGQVFACLGLLEAADVLRGPASARFDWRAGASTFSVRDDGEGSPVAAVLAFLAGATLHTESPAEDLTTARWDVATTHVGGACFPFPMPASPATLPAVLTGGGRSLRIDHWGDTERDNVKFWAGAGGYPGGGLLRDALGLVRAAPAGVDADPFAFRAPMSSSFRFDWRRDYVPLGVGFSLNNHSGMAPEGFPLVEILAAIGLQNARPHRPSARDKLLYRYRVCGSAWLRPPLHRAALGLAPLPLEARTFRVKLDWPGQENQARCITDVVEET